MSDGHNEEPRPGNDDRAWNEPPLFSYSSTASAQTKAAGPKLNKRIGFPDTSSYATAAASTTGVDVAPAKPQDAGAKSVGAAMPPPPPTASVPPPPIMKSSQSATSNRGVVGKVEVRAVYVDDVVTKLESFADRSALDESKRKGRQHVIILK
jgi:hypothetical protein